MKTMVRELAQWKNLDPELISKGSQAQIYFALKDARHDLLLLAEQRDALLAENSRLLEENLRYTANLREEAEKLSQQSGDALDAKRWRKINEIIEGVKVSRFENIMWGMGFDPYVDGDETHFQELVVRIDAAIAAAT